MPISRRHPHNRRRLDAAQRKAVTAGVLRRYGLPLLRAILGVGLTAGLWFGGRWTHEWALSSPHFRLQHLHFTGLVHAPEAELVRLAGLLGTPNLFLLDVTAAEKALAGHPWVRHAEVSRAFPATVQVKVEEHVAVAVASLGDLYLVNSDGEPFKKLELEDAVDLPLLTGLDREGYATDPRGSVGRLKVALALAHAYEASGASQRARLSEIRIGKEGLALVAENGQEVRFGEGAPEDALQRLYQVRAELARRGLSAQVIYLDNRARTDRVTVKLVPAQEPKVQPEPGGTGRVVPAAGARRLAMAKI